MKVLKPIAVRAKCNFGGIEILKIDYGIQDTVTIRENYGIPTKPEKRIIRYDSSGTPFFIFKGQSEYLNEYIKVNI